MIQSLLAEESGNGQCIPGTVLCIYLITDVLETKTRVYSGSLVG